MYRFNPSMLRQWRQNVSAGFDDRMVAAFTGPILTRQLVADGKVYVGTRRKDFWILAAGKEKQVLCSVELDGAMSSTPTAANGVLYIVTANRLYAVQEGGK